MLMSLRLLRPRSLEKSTLTEFCVTLSSCSCHLSCFEIRFSMRLPCPIATYKSDSFNTLKRNSKTARFMAASRLNFYCKPVVMTSNFRIKKSVGKKVIV